jgi:hypothetical protein
MTTTSVPDGDRKSRLFQWRKDVSRSDLSPTARHAALVISLFFDEKFAARPGASKLAEWTGWSERTVARAIEELRGGWLDVDSGGKGRANRYRMRTPVRESGVDSGTHVTESGVPLSQSQGTPVTESGDPRQSGGRFRGGEGVIGSDYQSKDSDASGGRGGTDGPAAPGDKDGSEGKTQSDASSTHRRTDPSTASVVEDLIEDIIEKDWSGTPTVTRRIVSSILATCLQKYPDPLVREVSRDCSARWTPEKPNQSDKFWLRELEDRFEPWLREEWDFVRLNDLESLVGSDLAPIVKVRAVAQGIPPRWKPRKPSLDPSVAREVALAIVQTSTERLDRWAVEAATNGGCVFERWDQDQEHVGPLDADGLCSDCFDVSEEDRKRAARLWHRRQEDVRQAVRGGTFWYGRPPGADLEAWRCSDDEPEGLDEAAVPVEPSRPEEKNVEA